MKSLEMLRKHIRKRTVPLGVSHVKRAPCKSQGERVQQPPRGRAAALCPVSGRRARFPLRRTGARVGGGSVRSALARSRGRSGQFLWVFSSLM